MRSSTRALWLAPLTVAVLALGLGSPARATDVDLTPPSATDQAAIDDKIGEGDKAKDEVDAAKDELGKAKDADAAKAAAAKLKAARAKLKKLRDEAIKMVDDKYDLTHPKKLKGEPGYDPDVAGEGVTSPKGEVSIGEDAFHDPAEKANAKEKDPAKHEKPNRPGFLASVKLHELTHVAQLTDGTWSGSNPPKDMPDGWAKQEELINEVQAYDNELDKRKKSKQTNASTAEIQRRRDELYKGLTDENKKKVDAKDYGTTCAATNAVAPPVAPPAGPPVATPPGGAAPGDHKRVPTVDPAHLPEGVGMTFEGTGTTHAVRAHVVNSSGQPVTIDVPTGATLVPSSPGVQTLISVANPPVTVWAAVDTFIYFKEYCIDRTLAPPAPGQPLTYHPPAASGGGGGPAALTLPHALLSAAEVLQELHTFLPTGATDAGGHPIAATTSVPPEKPPFEIKDWSFNVSGGYPVPPVGPYEGSHPPSISWGGARGTLPDFRRNADQSAAGFGALGPPTVVQPGAPAPTTVPRATFDDTILVWTAWTVANFGGQPNPQAVSDEAEKQFKAQGVPPEKAKAAGQQVALEVVPVVSLALARAQANAQADIDWSALDLTLKGGR